jgi:tetratricopeptide (TPR) repeat protein
LEAYNRALSAEETTAATLPALLSRAGILMDQRRYDQAREDYTEAFSLQGDLEIRAQRMEAAYLAGNLGTALNDAEALLGTGTVPDSEIQLLRARILIDEANANDTEELAEALSLIDNAGNDIPTDLQPVANEYRARAQFLMGSYDDALRSIEAALSATETGSRRFLRGQIFEALEQPDAAIGDYEWVITWSEIYPYPFLPDARRRLDDLAESAVS